MFGDDLDGAERRIGNWQSMLEDRARRAADLAVQARDLRATASVARGLVTATVDQGGHLVDLKLDGRVRDWPADEIAQAVLAAVTAARGELAVRVRELAAESGFADADS